MKIGYDGKRAVRNMTGLGNYSRLALESYAALFPNDSLLLYTPVMASSHRLDRLKAFPNLGFRFPASQGLKGSLWRTFGITNNLRADGVDIYHGLSNELPLNIRNAGVPSVVTIHDVIYRRLPECYTPVDRWLCDFKYSRSCRNADHIIAVSERTKQDVVDLYDISPDKISVVYQGCDPQFQRKWLQEEIDALRRRLGLPKRFILQTGTIERRKNLELTVRALSDISPDIDLVVVGRDHLGYKKTILQIAAATGVTSRIHFLGNVDFKDLPGLNQAAEIVVYPSRYEGFGIPVVEALESGTPVIAATGSCLEEAGGPDSLYVDPDSPSDMVQAVRALLSDPAAAHRRALAGREYALRFRGDMAEKMHDIYLKTLQASSLKQP